MTDDLTGTRVLAVVTNYGVEQDELTVPARELANRGATVTIAATEQAPIATLVGDKDPGETLHPDTTIAEVDIAAYDLLLVPGGTINADTLRTDAKAVALATGFAQAGKPIAAICHGPWLLVEADIVRGKNLTSYTSLQTDLRNAGADWADVEVRVCDDAGYRSITSRDPGDLTPFVAAISDSLAQVRA